MNNYILKSCPFCGGKAEMVHDSHRGADLSYVRCTVCGIEGPSVRKDFEYSSDDKAAEKWNTRYEEDIFGEREGED